MYAVVNVKCSCILFHTVTFENTLELDEFLEFVGKQQRCCRSVVFYFTISFTSCCFGSIHPEIVGKKANSESQNGGYKKTFLTPCFAHVHVLTMGQELLVFLTNLACIVF